METQIQTTEMLDKRTRQAWQAFYDQKIDLLQLFDQLSLIREYAIMSAKKDQKSA